MKLNFITLMVRDIEKSVEFYQELVGMQLINQINLEIGKIRFMANEKGETMLELVEINEGEKTEIKGMVMSYLATPSLEAVRERAISLGYTPSKIINHAPKPKHFTVNDPDGIKVEFTLQPENF
ncbi:MAG: VOC family protein [Lachnospiraceae bacterium]|nr:VOC family protein [Lachnospiraceae bacterium]